MRRLNSAAIIKGCFVWWVGGCHHYKFVADFLVVQEGQLMVHGSIKCPRIARRDKDRRRRRTAQENQLSLARLLQGKLALVEIGCARLF